MAAKFELAIPVILEHEGGYVDHPSDPGGATKWGISLRFLRSLGVGVGDVDGDGDVDTDDVRQLTREQAAEIYRTQWWDPMRLGEFRHQAVATKTLDLAVNMGRVPAVKLLQRALCVAGHPVDVDGVIGPQTIRAVNSADPDLLLELYRVQAARYYHELVDRRPDLVVFERGWIRRALA